MQIGDPRWESAKASAWPIAETDCPVLRNDPVTDIYRHLVLEAPDGASKAAPGQFFHFLCPVSESRFEDGRRGRRVGLHSNPYFFHLDSTFSIIAFVGSATVPRNPLFLVASMKSLSVTPFASDEGSSREPWPPGRMKISRPG